MISSVAFRNFKALREARVDLQPFNLIVGPNGSGKTSLIQALLRLRTLSGLAVGPTSRQQLMSARKIKGSSILEFGFAPPYEDVVARLSCVEQLVCDQIEFSGVAGTAQTQLQQRISGIRSYLFDHYAMAEPSLGKSQTSQLTSNGANLAAVLAELGEREPECFSRLERELRQIVPEFEEIEVLRSAGESGREERVSLALRLREGGGEWVTADNLSQGTLYLLAVLFLVFQPEPPSVVCIEEIDRGIHPRLLRPLRDLLYRLSYPSEFGEGRAPVQVLVTTHSPYLLDLFKDHPEEIIISHKQGLRAHFERLSDRADVGALLGEASLGDLWFSGILGGVPEEAVEVDGGGGEGGVSL